MNKDIFLSIVNGTNKEILNENANMSSDTPAGMMYKFASETSKAMTMELLLSGGAKDAVESNHLHIHDMDYYPTHSTTCLQHPLDKILAKGFVANDGQARPCKRIETAGALAAIAMQTIQNEQHGGQAIPAFDFYLAPYVRTTFIEELEKYSDLMGIDYSKYYNMELKDYVVKDSSNPIQLAINNTVHRVHQTMESFIHNMNTMRSRGGGQTVFSSINYGTDTSAEGRCVIRELLKATERGVGNGATAIFPIQIWKLKKGVSAEQGDPNYDLLQLAYRVTAKRFFPNFINLDAPFNQHEKWNSNDPERYKYEVATMGCRTRVFDNRCGEKTSIGRGNLSFTTVNLVRIALESEKNIDKFFELLSIYVDVAVYQLRERFDYQSKALKKQFPLLMSGMWDGSDNLKADDTVGEVLKQGTLSVGFIGLAECLVALIGKHHGEDEDAQNLGLRIVKFMNDRCQEWGRLTELNISVIATPAEGLAGKFVKKDREDFGVIENVTDRDY